MSRSYLDMCRDWIRGQLAKRGRGARVRLSEATGLTPDQITRILQDDPEKEQRDISASEMEAIIKHFGERPPFEIRPDPPSSPERNRKIAAPKAIPLKAIGRRIPVYEWVSAGRLAQHHAQDVLGHIRIAELPKTTGKADWIALKVEGDSMDRISPPESIILVNRNEKTLIQNACYIIGDEAGNATYKRYRPDPMRFEAVSINPEHQPIFPEEAPLIVGRVRRTILDM